MAHRLLMVLASNFGLFAQAHRRALLQIKEDREKVKIRRVHGPGEGAESAAQSSSSSSSRPVSTVAERLAQEQKRQKILEREVGCVGWEMTAAIGGEVL